MDANIQKYQAFVETVRTGSFTRAARSLSYTQSGVSRMIADLERDWGMTLLERSRAGVTLTSEGRAVLPFVEGVCDDYRRLESQIDDLNGLAAGSIRIGTFSSVATHILPKVIGRFQKDYPAIEYELLMGDYTEIDGWVASGRVDFGFLPRAPRYSGLAERVIERDELMAVLPVGHRLAGEASVPVSALCEEPFIVLERGQDDEITPIFERAGLSPNARFSTWDDYAIMSMVESGLGIAILPSLILTRNPYHIVTRPLEPRAIRTVNVVFRRQEELPLATKRFLSYLDFRNEPTVQD